MDPLVSKSLGISNEDLYDLLSSVKSLLVYDIRTREQFESGHIQGSIHAVCDFDVAQTIMPDIPRSTKIVLVDGDGVTSSELAVAMRSLGFDSYFLKNGIKNWNGNLVKKVSGEIHSPTFCIRRG
ncbi:MAG: rhodanese-like domain-containing protein [Thaumarchaeota archaeon]|nr:rhodanese-like domain-containing protein [Nitrososphaerota archaeon]